MSILSASQVPEEDWGPFRGRAQGSTLERVRSRATPDRPHLRSGPAECSAVSTTLFERYCSLRRSGEDQELCAVLLQRQPRELDHQDVCGFVGRDLKGDAETVFVCLYDVRLQATQDLEDLGEVADRLASCAHARSLADARRSFDRWTTEQSKNKPGLLRRHVKQAPAGPLESVAAGSTNSQPAFIMAAKQQSWQAKWLDPVDPLCRYLFCYV